MQNNNCSFIWKNYYIVQTQSKKRDKGYLVYINAESGEVAQTVKLGIPGCDGNVVMVDKSFAIHNDVLWYQSQHYYLCCIDLNTGKHLDSRISGCGVENFTQMKLSIFVLSSIHIHNGKLYLQGAKMVGIENPRTAKHVDSGLYECDIESREIKAVNIEHGVMFGFEIYRGKYLFLQSDSKLSVMDMTTGERVGITIPNKPTTYCMTDDRLYLVGGNMVHTALFSASENNL